MRTLASRIGWLTAIALALSACGGALERDPTRVARPIGAHAAGTAAGSRANARRVAAAVLAELRLPAGAVQVAREPAGDPDPHGRFTALEGDSANVLRHQWWVVPASASTVMEYVGTHRPAGSRLTLSEGVNSFTDYADAGMLGFTWPRPGPRIVDRLLEVSATPMPGGRTAVLAAVQIDWLVPRPAGEGVPAGVTAVSVTLTRPARTPQAKHPGTTSRALITGSASVATAIRLVDALEVAQPISYGCPADVGPVGSLTVRYSAGPAGPALAEADVDIYVGWGAPGLTGCDPIGFSVRGHGEQALVGGSFVRRMLALAGLHR